MAGFLFGGGGGSLDNIIATGSTEPRSASDRFGDIHNVLDFGADPTGLTDSAAAINAAVNWNTVTLIATANQPTANILTFASQTIPADFDTDNAIFAYNVTDPLTMPNAYVEYKSGDTVVISVNCTAGGVQIGDQIEFYYERRGTIRFPAGNYTVNSTIDYNGPKHIRFEGSPGATITGSFAGPIFNRQEYEGAGPVETNMSFEHLRISNTHASGKGITCHRTIGTKISNCFIDAGIGIETYNSQSITVQNCHFGHALTEMTSGTVGIMAGNATTIIACDFMGFEHGVRHQNAGLTLIGGRFENNHDAIALGINEDGDPHQSQSVFICGPSLESNSGGIYLGNCATFEIAGVAVTGGEEALTYGYYINNAAYGTFVGCTASVSLGFSTGGLYITDVSNVSFVNCSFQNPVVPDTEANVQFDNCTYIHEITVASLPTAASNRGVMLNVKDAATTAIGAAVTTGSSTNHYTVCANTAGWMRIA